jgi:hypothetical protein
MWTAYYMALFLDSSGNRDGAFRELERAVEENSTMLYILDAGSAARFAAR